MGLFGDLGINFDTQGLISKSLSHFGDLIVSIIILGLGIYGLYYYYDKKTYNKKILLWEDINGTHSPTKRYNACRKKVNEAKFFYIKELKDYIEVPRKQIGINQYWFFVCQDGEWMNAGVKSFNKTTKELELDLDHHDMRQTNAANRKLLKDSFKKKNWLQEYAPYIAIAGLLLISGVIGYLFLDKGITMMNAVAGQVEASREVTKTLNEILAHMDNIYSGSGVK